MIKVHFDFTDGTELSFSESINNRTTDFTTHSLEVIDQWLTFDRLLPEILVLRKDGSYIDIREVLNNDGKYGEKYLTREHSLTRMIKADALKWQPPKETEGLIVKGQTVVVLPDSVLNDVFFKREAERLSTQVNKTWSTLSSESSENFQKLADTHAKNHIRNIVNSLRTMDESELIPKYLSHYGLTEEDLKSGDPHESS